jgi:predicted nucleotidyltransferase
VAGKVAFGPVAEEEGPIVHIDPNASFAGVALGRVQRVVSSLQGRDWTMDELRELLDVDEETFERVAEKLRGDRLIEVTHQWPHGVAVWHNTLGGGRLANASVTDRVPRERAQRHVDGLLERVRAVNASNRFLYRIRRIRLFGSLLRPDRALVSDADVAIDLEPKERDGARHRALMEKQAAEATHAGRRFSDVRERTWWGLDKVWRFLQGDSELLHLVPPEDKVLDRADTRILYEQR